VVMVFVVSEARVISAKVPEELYKEMALRVPEGDRSDFIREAIIEKLQKTPKTNKILELEERMGKIERELGEVRKYLADLELLTFGQEKANPHNFCIDELDHKIVDYLLHYKGATTPELAEYMKINRWLVLNRLRKMQKTSKKQYGKAVIDYYAGEKSGKKKAWWINEELVQGE
jgi:Arc/MetJ-type ribon-helix-helix transcriptional regulator